MDKGPRTQDTEVNKTPKERLIETLKTSEGKRKFMGDFEEILKGYREFVKRGGDFILQKAVVDDMKEVADQIRGELPEIAIFLDQARKRVEDLIERGK